jgi:uncharacterized membrane protein YkvA (DUF1232 family)
MNADQIFQQMKKIAAKAGREVITKALTLWFCLQDKDTPARIKAIIIGDLLYLISPIDAIPDAIPGIGFSDDLAVLTLAFGILAAHIKPEHHERAKAKVDEWLNR